MRNIVLISFTPLNAGGGVPRWNRDFIAGFPGTKHFSWWDVPEIGGQVTNEWTAAAGLTSWLINTKKVTRDDIIIADGFWGESFSTYNYNVISVAHGIWSHLTKEDVDAGKQPDFPIHHQNQVDHRRRHLMRGGKIVAVSDFISNQMRLQWGFESSVINNAIDLERFKPPITRVPLERPLVIHGVTNSNKGFDHIRAVEKVLDGVADVMLLDDAAKKLGIDKYDALGHAMLVVQPSAYEGNSYFVLETLACDVPIVAYNVGLLNSLSKICTCEGEEYCCVGSVIDRKLRSPEMTAKITKFIFESLSRERSIYAPRKMASHFSIDNFHIQWRKYLEEYERNLKG